jgi:hypothetical protein
VESHTDTVVNRVNLMNSLCVKPILSVSKVFIYLKDNTGPSGSNYDLYPNYQARWDSFKLANASVLDLQHLEMIYVCDEPTWNGVTYSELNTICTTIKNDYPNIPLATVEAYTMVNQIQVPTGIDLLGFDHYGIYDVSTDANYLAWLDTLEQKRSTPSQRIILVFDEEWNAGFWPSNFTPDSMETVLDNYYKLALNDTNVVALVGFTWPGIAPGWLGARSLPQHVIDKSVLYGQLIKANYNPCTSGIAGRPVNAPAIKIYPNPAGDELNFDVKGNTDELLLRIYNGRGQVIKESSLIHTMKLSASEYAPGIYYYQLSSREGVLGSGKFVKE